MLVARCNSKVHTYTSICSFLSQTKVVPVRSVYFSLLAGNFMIHRSFSTSWKLSWFLRNLNRISRSLCYRPWSDRGSQDRRPLFPALLPSPPFRTHVFFFACRTAVSGPSLLTLPEKKTARCLSSTIRFSRFIFCTYNSFFLSLKNYYRLIFVFTFRQIEIGR